jgi:hypothetical protein
MQATNKVTASKHPISGATKTPNQEDKLLAAAFASWQEWDRERAIVDALPEGDPTFDDRYKAYAGPWHKRAEQITFIPAHTPEGIHAKAVVLRAWYESHHGAPQFDEDESLSIKLAWSLVNDILGKA